MVHSLQFIASALVEDYKPDKPILSLVKTLRRRRAHEQLIKKIGRSRRLKNIDNLIYCSRWLYDFDFCFDLMQLRPHMFRHVKITPQSTIIARRAIHCVRTVRGADLVYAGLSEANRCELITVDLVRSNWRWLGKLANQPTDVCLELCRKYKWPLLDVRDPTPEMIEAGLKTIEKSARLVDFCRRLPPSPEVAMAIANTGCDEAYRFLRHQTEDASLILLEKCADKEDAANAITNPGLGVWIYVIEKLIPVPAQWGVPSTPDFIPLNAVHNYLTCFPWYGYLFGDNSANNNNENGSDDDDDDDIDSYDMDSDDMESDDSDSDDSDDGKSNHCLSDEHCAAIKKFLGGYRGYRNGDGRIDGFVVDNIFLIDALEYSISNLGFNLSGWSEAFLFFSEKEKDFQPQVKKFCAENTERIITEVCKALSIEARRKLASTFMRHIDLRQYQIDLVKIDGALLKYCKNKRVPIVAQAAIYQNPKAALLIVEDFPISVYSKIMTKKVCSFIIAQQDVDLLWHLRLRHLAPNLQSQIEQMLF